MRILDLEQAKASVLRRARGAAEASPEMRRRERTVERILAQVRSEGDAALFRLEKKLDRAELSALEVGREEIESAYLQTDKSVTSALKLAAQRVEDFHKATLEALTPTVDVGQVGLLVRALDIVGLYVPGGTASYPSTVLMSAIPARVAGVREIIVATPPRSDGSVAPATLVAAGLAGVSRIFKLGGAQAIVALAYGTATVPRVDKICGPGNVFVQMAKRMVYGEVDIDGIYGPTETVIIADSTASPALCAADLLAQAEHDPMASAILLTTSRKLAGEVDRQVDKQLAGLDRAETVRKSLDGQGAIVLCRTLEAALEAANEYAPEHLCLMVKDARSHLSQVRNAGGIFLGESSAEALGDYVAGPSHIMPTGGTARFGSPLGVGHFLKTTSVFDLSPRSTPPLARAASILARAEGLTAHARAAEMRLKVTP